jgi:hypothetical protein
VCFVYFLLVQYAHVSVFLLEGIKDLVFAKSELKLFSMVFAVIMLILVMKVSTFPKNKK